MPINTVVKDIIQEFNITNFVETGVYECATTRLVLDMFKKLNVENFAMWEVDIYEPYVLAGRDEFSDKRINFVTNNSVDFIQEHIENGMFENDRTLFFLDAHIHLKIGSDVLYEEVKKLVTLKNKPIIMIDDFRNPLNSSHSNMLQYGIPLDIDYIRPLIHNRTDIFYCPTNCRPDDCVGQGIIFVDEYENTLRDRLKNIKVQGSRL